MIVKTSLAERVCRDAELHSNLCGLIAQCACRCSVRLQPWTDNLGVIHLLDNNHTYGSCDVLLHPGKCTDAFPIQWSSAAAYYVGPGYSAVQYPEGRPNERTIRGSGTWGIGEPVGVVARRTDAS